MAKKLTGGNTTYHVVVQGIKLDSETEKRIEVEIRRVVLQELASVDLKGDLQISPLEKFPALFETEALTGPGGHTAGIVAREV